MNKHPGIEYVNHRTVMQLEGGITQISLENADYLLRHFGLPTHIELIKQGDEYLVMATWLGTTHLFTGFSWGYGGEGPNGLNRFFKACGLKDIGRWGWDAYNLDVNDRLVVLADKK